MTAEARVDRRAYRRNDPAALATILVSQLTAYRCSTIYAPNATKLDVFVKDEVLPRLRERIDVRTVVVERWDKKAGPTVQQLVDAIRSQLDIDAEDEPDKKPLAVLEATLHRAERRSERPLLLVLYRLEELLDDKRDAAEVRRFVDALARMAAMPMHGLHLVLGVKEEDLGAFRDLLRGRWRLLANDIRIRPSGKKWLLSLPLVVFAYVSSKTAAVAAVATACVGTGAAAGAVAGAQICDQREALAECRAEVGQLRGGKKGRRPPAKRSSFAEVTSTTTTTTTTTTTGTTDGTDGETDSTDSETDSADGTSSDTDSTGSTDSDTDGALQEVELAPVKLDLCAPHSRDGECATCVRSQCCADLKSCRSSKWRRCVLSGRSGTGECQPEAIEQDCRALALCGLEYTCRAACFAN